MGLSRLHSPLRSVTISSPPNSAFRCACRPFSHTVSSFISSVCVPAVFTHRFLYFRLPVCVSAIFTHRLLFPASAVHFPRPSVRRGAAGRARGEPSKALRCDQPPRFAMRGGVARTPWAVLNVSTIPIISFPVNLLIISYLPVGILRKHSLLKHESTL